MNSNGQPINECMLGGWFTFEQFTVIEEMEQKTPAVFGVLCTDKPYFGGAHPIVLYGKAAQVIHERIGENTSIMLHILIRGKLRSFDGHSRVAAKHVTILEQGTNVTQLLEDLHAVVNSNGNGNGSHRREIAAVLAKHGVGNSQQKGFGKHNLEDEIP